MRGWITGIWWTCTCTTAWRTFFSKDRRPGYLAGQQQKARGPYTQAAFRDRCYLIFGKETAGLPRNFEGARGALYPHPHPGAGRV